MSSTIGILVDKDNIINYQVDKDNVINYQVVINYRLSTRTLINQPTVDKTNRLVNQLLIVESLWIIVDMEIDKCSKGQTRSSVLTLSEEIPFPGRSSNTPCLSHRLLGPSFSFKFQPRSSYSCQSSSYNRIFF